MAPPHVFTSSMPLFHSIRPNSVLSGLFCPWLRPPRRPQGVSAAHAGGRSQPPCGAALNLGRARATSFSSSDANLDKFSRRIIVLTQPYATHIFAYAVHLEQEGLTQTLRDACFAQNAADTTTRAYALHTLYNGHLLHLIFGYGC